MKKEPWAFHGDVEHPVSECENCELCCKTLEAFNEFKKTQEYQGLINSK